MKLDTKNDPLLGAVGGVLIWTAPDHFDKMLIFYRDILSLPLRGERTGFANFAWGNFKLTLGVHTKVSGVNHDPLRIMVNFLVTDIQGSYEKLRDRNVFFTRKPEEESWGGWVTTFADPDGNTLQLLQLPD